MYKINHMYVFSNIYLLAVASNLYNCHDYIFNNCLAYLLRYAYMSQIMYASIIWFEFNRVKKLIGDSISIIGKD